MLGSNDSSVSFGALTCQPDDYPCLSPPLFPLSLFWHFATPQTLSAPADFDAPLSRAPVSARDALGRFRVAACVVWASSAAGWSPAGCAAWDPAAAAWTPAAAASSPGRARVYADTTTGGGNSLRAECRCTRLWTVAAASGSGGDGGGPAGVVAVVDAPAGCDGGPYSTVVKDACGVCGGDNSTCIGCDDVVARWGHAYACVSEFIWADG